MLHVRASASVLYIVQFPTPPPRIGVEECTQCCHGQFGSSIRRAGALWGRCG